MHARLLSGAQHGLTVLRATGFTVASAVILLALVVTLVFHDGTIERIGPLTLYPALHVMVAVPLLLSVACGIAHAPFDRPVIARNARTRVARVLSLGSAAAASVLVIGLGAGLDDAATLAPALRNLALFGALAVTVSVLVGAQHAWVPVVLLFCAAVTSSPGGTWTLYSLVLGTDVPPEVGAATTVVSVVVLALTAWDPRGLGYLRVVADRRAPRASAAQLPQEVVDAPVEP